MSTNYYYHEKPPCECCGREYPARHIGKSSAGWVFFLHVGNGVGTLDDWKAVWDKGGCIRDEYGQAVTAEEMLRIITKRVGTRRSEVAGNCIGQGGGTWEYVVGEFS
jgi:hypothetical protein